MLRPARSFRKHAETEDIQHEEVYGGAAAHGELSLQVGVSPQVCVIQGTPSTAASSRSPLVLTVSTCYMVVGGSLSYLQVPGESPGYFYSFHQESPLAKELSVFVDESDARPRSPTSPCSSANFPFPIQRSSTDAVSSKTRQG